VLRAKLGALTPAIGAIGFVALWWAVHRLGLIDPVLLPSPGDALRAIWDGVVGGTLVGDSLITIRRTLAAFAIAVAVGVPLGVVLGSSQRVYSSVEFVIDFFRSTPASAMFPLFLVILGVGEGTKVAVAAFGAALMILFNTAYGVMNARKTRQAAARVMGASPARVMLDVTLLESLPQTFVGMRTGISFALVIVIVAEMLARDQRADDLQHAGDVRHDLRRRRARVRPQPAVSHDRAEVRALGWQMRGGK